MSDKKISVKNIIVYTIGIIIIGLSVTFLLRADLGVGAWDATSFNFNDMITTLINNTFNSDVFITYGTTSFIISMILLTVVILYKGFKKKHLLVFASIFLMSLSIDLWNLVLLNNFQPEAMHIRIILFISAAILLPFSLSLLIISKLAASVYDEFTMVAGEVLKIKKFSVAKMVIEVFGITLAFIFSLVTYFVQPAGMMYTMNGHINLGTVLLTFTIGPIIGLFLNIFNKDKNTTK